MDADTLEALRGSITKWEGVVAGTLKDEGWRNCPLCLRFNADPVKIDCRGCPVMDATGEKGCLDSPYDLIAQAEEYGEDSNQYKEAAQAELDFLKSLLPESPK